jgi:hypothetical protein
MTYRVLPLKLTSSRRATHEVYDLHAVTTISCSGDITSKQRADRRRSASSAIGLACFLSAEWISSIPVQHSARNHEWPSYAWVVLLHMQSPHDASNQIVRAAP